MRSFTLSTPSCAQYIAIAYFAFKVITLKRKKLKDWKIRISMPFVLLSVKEIRKPPFHSLYWVLDNRPFRFVSEKAMQYQRNSYKTPFSLRYCPGCAYVYDWVVLTLTRIYVLLPMLRWKCRPNILPVVLLSFFFFLIRTKQQELQKEQPLS